MKKQLVLSLILICLLMRLSGQTTAYEYYHPEQESYGSKSVKFVAGLIGMQKTLERRMDGRRIPQQAASIPRSLSKKYNVSIQEVAGRKVWTIKPKNYTGNKTVIYLHGGAYILNISSIHWQFIGALLEQSPAIFVVPDYPLAPQHTCTEVFAFMHTLYQQLLPGSDNGKQLLLMGDSAGGGLALAFAQYLGEHGLPQATQLILLSPWLDAGMTNPDLKLVEKSDKILGIKGLRLCGKAYAGTLPLDDYKLSPLFGELGGLGKISIFIGTHDLFIADCRKLKTLLGEQEIAYHYYEYPKLFHAFMVGVYLKEAQHAIRQIGELIR